MADARKIEPNIGLHKLALLLEALKLVGTKTREWSGPGTPGAYLGQFVEGLIGEKAAMAEDAAHGFPPTKGEGWATTPKKEYAADFSSLVPQGGPVTTALNGVLGKMGSAALVGALRPGGRPDIIASRGMAGRQLFDDTGKLFRELYSPSLAITGEGKLNNPFAPLEDVYKLLLIPKLGAFDPAYSRSTLRNRDFYSPRGDDFLGVNATAQSSRDHISERLADRFSRPDPPPWTEGEYRWVQPDFIPPPLDTGHRMLAGASPTFRSFAEFERSKKGAGVLTDESGQYTASWKLEAALTRWQGKQTNPNFITNRQPLEGLRRAAQEGDPEAITLLRYAQTAPSNYAELKVHGPVPLSSDYWAGVIGTRDPKKTDFVRNLAASLNDRGIPYIFDTGTASERFKIAEELQHWAGPVSARRLGSGFDAHSWPMMDYNKSLDPKFDPGKIKGKPVEPPLPDSEPALPTSAQLFEGGNWSPAQYISSLEGQPITAADVALLKEIQTKTLYESPEWKHIGKLMEKYTEDVTEEEIASVVSKLPALSTGGFKVPVDSPLLPAAKKALALFHSGKAGNTIFTVMGKKYQVDPHSAIIMKYV